MVINMRIGLLTNPNPIFGAQLIRALAKEEIKIDLIIVDKKLTTLKDIKIHDNRTNNKYKVETLFNEKLKVDHIKFKNENFEKVGNTKNSWKVKTSNECKFGKWINEAESKAKSFTKTSNWSNLKVEHEKVHSLVQEYVDVNANDSRNNDRLKDIATNLEVSMRKVFSSLDQIKKENDVKIEKTNNNQARSETKKQTQSELSNSSTTDEWESF